MGGGGFGSAAATTDGSGGGGGGALDARPVGFIEITADGTRFERIDDGRMALRARSRPRSLVVLVAGRVPSRRRARRRSRCARGAPRRARGAAAPPAPPRVRGLLRCGAAARAARGGHSSQRS